MGFSALPIFSSPLLGTRSLSWARAHISQHLAEPAALSPPPFIFPVMESTSSTAGGCLAGCENGSGINGTGLLVFLPVEYGRGNLTSLNFQQKYAVE